MYKLTYFKATNIAGFVSGLQRKTFEVDLREFSDKEIIVILGDNGTGKSTFLSFIHPIHTPTNKKKKFVMEGKEGSLIREYTSDDGTIISTRAIYTPSGTKHTSKLFFKIMYPDGNEIELNPNGNVSSYYDLVKEYFGINQDFINFASYNNTVKGIVSMTDSERKNNVSSLMPNTTRFELAFSVINEKHKEYRSIIRNISQKILKLRDEPLLKAELRRQERAINDYTDSRETLIKKIARGEGRIKELSDGKDIGELLKEYKIFNKELANITDSMSKLSYIAEYDFSKIKSSQASLKKSLDDISSKQLLFTDRLQSKKNSLYDNEDKLDKLEILLENLQTVDLDSLIQLKRKYEQWLLSSRYNPKDSFYETGNYSDCIKLIEALGKISNSVMAILESYGYYLNEHWTKGMHQCLKEKELTKKRLDFLIADTDRLKSESTNLQIKMAGLNEYRNLEEILSRRPTNCHIDTCPFITQALKWNDIKFQLEKLEITHFGILEEIEKNTREIEDNSNRYHMLENVETIEKYMDEFEPFIKRYIGISFSDVCKDIAKGVDKFDKYIKIGEDIAAILSEKDHYNDIVQNKLPDIEKQINLHETNNVANKYLLESFDTLNKSIKLSKQEIKQLETRLATLNTTVAGTRKSLEEFNILSDDVDKYIKLKELFDELVKNQENYLSKISTISSLVEKQDEYKNEMKSIDKLISGMMVTREQYKYELNSLLELKAEKELVEQNFNITYIMKSIIQPGKGLWKEILEIYMYDIKNIANHLLLNTFDGNLYLENFIILDESFIIPYVYKGTLGADISLASDSQQSTISTAMSLAILSKMISKYGISSYDEVDKDLSPLNKESFINILAKQSKYVGINQNFIITHNPDYYEPYEVGYVLFPGSTLRNKKNKDIIEI